MSLAIANLVLAAFMGGVIWFVGVVHYPLFARVGRDGWAAYERAHQTRTTFVVAVPMLLQVPVALALVLAAPAGVSGAAAAGNLACVLVAFLSTVLVFAPAHGRLQREWSDAGHRRLVRGNCLRVVAWTAQTAFAAAVVSQAA